MTALVPQITQVPLISHNQLLNLGSQVSRITIHNCISDPLLQPTFPRADRVLAQCRKRPVSNSRICNQENRQTHVPPLTLATTTWMQEQNWNQISILTFRIICLMPMIAMVMLSTVKPPEEHVRRPSQMPKRDRYSDNNMSKRRRRSYAETLRCTANASLATHAPTLMENISFRRKPIFQAILWLSSVPNSMKTVFVFTEKDANSYTASMTLRPSWATAKLWSKEPDWPRREMTKSAPAQVLNAFGLILRLGMVVALQRSQDLLASKPSITKSHTLSNKLKSGLMNQIISSLVIAM